MADTRIQVLKGHFTDAELAALTSVLNARATAIANGRQAEARDAIAGWHRLERHPAYHSPLSWQTAFPSCLIG